MNYKEIKGVPVNSHTYEEIQGTSAIPQGVPFRLGHLPEFSLVSVNGHMGEDERFLRDSLVKISPIHGRSYEFRFGQTRQLFWDDEYGNLFSTITTKGNNLEEPKVFRQDNAPKGFAVYGMQDSSAMVRMLKASDILRAEGVDTEMILRVMEPQELPFGDQVVPLAEFKRLLVKKVWNQNAEEDSVDDNDNYNLTRKDIPAISAALGEMTLFITVRGFQVSERMADLAQTTTPEEVKAILAPAFTYANMNEQRIAKQDSLYESDHFELDCEEDIKRFLTQYLPVRAARNFATLHRRGLIHLYPHTGNISLVGSLYDLDSVHGEPLGLGDDKVTIDNIKSDLHTFLVVEMNSFPSPATIIDRVSEGSGKIFSANFLKEYFKQMDWEGDIIRFADISEFITACDLSETEVNAAEYFQKVQIPKAFLDRQLIKEISCFFNEHTQAVMAEHKGSQVELLAMADGLWIDLISMQLCHLYTQSENITSQADRDRALFFFDLYSKVMFEKYGMRMFLQIPFEQKEQDEDANPKKVAQLINSFYEKVIRAWGWEEDIAAHIDVIDRLFDGFSDIDDREYLRHYCEKLKQQLGLEISIDKPIGEMVSEFAWHDEGVMTTTVDIGMKEAEESEDPRQAALRIISGGNEEGINYTTDPYSRYTQYVIHRLETLVKDAMGEEVEETLVEKYRGPRFKLMLDWICRDYEDVYINHLPTLLHQTIIMEAERRLQNLLAEY